MESSGVWQRWLSTTDLLADCDDADLARFEAVVEEATVGAGETLTKQGDTAESFLIIDRGSVRIRRDGDDGVVVDLGIVGPGSIVGEAALLSGGTRTASAVAETEVHGLVGGADAFSVLFQLPGVADRLTRLAGQRLAAHVVPVPVTARDGQPFTLRPLLPSDRDELDDAIKHLSDRSRRLRFFTGGTIPPKVVDYLADLDYLNHFAWIVAGVDGRGVGVSRFIRDAKESSTAELAVALSDGQQGLGLGGILLGAMAVAADVAGVETLTASVLSENAPMRALLDRVGAHWTSAEPGVVETAVAVADVRSTIDASLGAELETVARQTMAAAAVPLSRTPAPDVVSDGGSPAP